MRTLLLIDEDFLRRERSMLERLEVALRDAGVEVLWALPRLDPPAPMRVLSAQTTYERSTFGGNDPLSTLAAISMPASRARGLVKALDELGFGGARQPINVVHAFGEGVWTLAVEAARQLGCATAIEIAGARSASRTRAFERKWLEAEPGAPALVWCAASAPLRDLALDALALSPVAVTRWGVFVPREPWAWQTDDTPPGLALLAPGRQMDELLSACRGLARAGADGVEFMVVAQVEGQSAVDRLWRELRTLGLLDRVTLADDLERRRDLALRCDALIIPEEDLGQRSLVLDAMAGGLTVVAREDAAADNLIDGVTALVAPAPSVSVWEQAFRTLFFNRARAREVGLSAREWVKERRTASGHAREIADVYAWLVQGGHGDPPGRRAPDPASRA